MLILFECAGHRKFRKLLPLCCVTAQYTPAGHDCIAFKLVNRAACLLDTGNHAAHVVVQEVDYLGGTLFLEAFLELVRDCSESAYVAEKYSDVLEVRLKVYGFSDDGLGYSFVGKLGEHVQNFALVLGVPAKYSDFILAAILKFPEEFCVEVSLVHFMDDIRQFF